MSRRTIEAEGDNAVYLDTYAWILYLKKQYAQADIYIKEALRYTDEVAENASIFEHAGDIVYSTGNRHAAFGYWRKALTLTTDRGTKRRLQRKLHRSRYVR